VVPRPRAHFGAATILALDPFTSTNGATVIFPGSHKWGADRLPKIEDGMPCVMDAGDAVFFLSTLWHGGGSNRTSNANRMAVTFQYCQPFIRPQENQFLSVPFATAKQLPPQIQSLLGYSVHPPFIGHSNGLHPLKALAKL
jgi:ectoine hydroxylase-related dioxygenase (phytanoyl-CoA dioxygenase family)